MSDRKISSRKKVFPVGDSVLILRKGIKKNRRISYFMQDDRKIIYATTITGFNDEQVPLHFFAENSVLYSQFTRRKVWSVAVIERVWDDGTTDYGIDLHHVVGGIPSGYLRVGLGDQEGCEQLFRLGESDLYLLSCKS